MFIKNFTIVYKFLARNDFISYKELMRGTMWLGTIVIVPEAQKQTRFVFRGGHPIAYDPSKKYKELIQWQLRPHAPKEMILGPIDMNIYFYMPIPKGTSKIKQRLMQEGKIYHIKRPDIDNLAYVVTNALKGIVYKDDSQIVNLHLYKRYAEKPKICISAMDLNEEARKDFYGI